MRILVTGASGFIGRHLFQEALRRGLEITAIVRPGRADALRELARGVPGVDIVERSPRCLFLGSLTTSSFGALINLVGPKDGSTGASWEANVEFTRRLTISLRAIAVSRIVHFSSVSVYGGSARAGRRIIREDDSPRPDTWYGTTKMLAESIWADFHRETGTPVTILRPSWVIGHGSRLLDKYLFRAAKSRVLVYAASGLPMNGVYVKDVARAGLTAALAELDGLRIYNINTISVQPLRAFVKALEQEVPGVKVPLFVPTIGVRLLSMRSEFLRFLLSGLYFDAAKARDDLDFIPRYDPGSMVCDMLAAVNVTGEDVRRDRPSLPAARNAREREPRQR